MAALDGILVVSLEQGVAAPLCTARLAEGGACIIKLERAEGDLPDLRTTARAAQTVANSTRWSEPTSPPAPRCND